MFSSTNRKAGVKSFVTVYLKDVNPNPTLKRQEEKEQLSVG